MKKTCGNTKNGNTKRSKTASRNTKDRGSKRGQSRSYRPTSRDEQFDKDNTTNDPKWYSSDPAIMRDAASIPFSMSTGLPVNLTNELAIPLADTYEKVDDGKMVAFEDAFPGIAAMRIMPTFGYATSQLDPLNIAATAVYSFIRHANSGSKNYDAPDLMLYIMSMTQIYSYIVFLQRVYGTAMLYVQRNRYIPYTLLQSMNVDYTDVQEHLSDFRYIINVFISKVSAMAVPAEFDIFRRQAFLYQNVYTEGTSIKDQMYLLMPDGFWMFGLNDSNKSGQLAYLPFRTFAVRGTNEDVPFTVNDLYTYGNKLLNAVMLNEDMNIMSGDILKAYGDSGILKVSSLEPDYMITPILDIAFLEQFKNATLRPGAWFQNKTNQQWGSSSKSVPAIIQDVATNAIVSTPTLIGADVVTTIGATTYYVNYDKRGTNGGLYIGAGLAERTLNPIITTTTADVSPELVMENTRLMNAVKRNGSNTSGYDYLVCGTEVGRDVAIYTRVPNSNSARCMRVGSIIWQYVSQPEAVQGITNAPDFNSELQDGYVQRWLCGELLSQLSPFKFLPTMWVLKANYTQSGQVNTRVGITTLIGLLGQIDNYTVISPDVLGKIHEAALINQLNVKAIARNP